MVEQMNSSAQELSKAAREIKTAHDFAKVMTLLMAAVASGEIKSDEANSIVRIAMALLKAVEMQLRYQKNNFVLTDGDVKPVPAPVAPKALPPKVPSKSVPKQGGPWCSRCYQNYQDFNKAVKEFEEEDLCLRCYNILISGKTRGEVNA